MQKHIAFFIMIILAFSSILALAQYTNDQQGDESGAPSGMVAKKVNNDVTVLMPKGSVTLLVHVVLLVDVAANRYVTLPSRE